MGKKFYEKKLSQQREFNQEEKLDKPEVPEVLWYTWTTPMVPHLGRQYKKKILKLTNQWKQEVDSKKLG